MSVKYRVIWSLIVIMSIIAYIRPDKCFSATQEQLQAINSYAISKNIMIDDEFIDHISQNKRISDRKHVTDYLQNMDESTLLVYDTWVLSTNIEDLTQMFSCLLRHKFKVHFIKQAVVMSHESSSMLVLGLIDQLRQTIQSKSKRLIGRPKGSKSSSKFDKYVNEIIAFIKDKKNVSEMSRILGVSRSSLKDYIESRELKQVAFASLLVDEPENPQQQVIDSVICPNLKENK